MFCIMSVFVRATNCFLQRQALFVRRKPFFSSEQVTKVQKTMGPGIEPICGVSVIWPFLSADLLGPLGF